MSGVSRGSGLSMNHSSLSRGSGPSMNHSRSTLAFTFEGFFGKKAASNGMRNKQNHDIMLFFGSVCVCVCESHSVPKSICFMFS